MANDFSTDPSCVAVWNFESGALTTDSQSINTLTNVGVAEETGDYKQGSGCADFEQAEADYLYRLDANLSADFPFKYGTVNRNFSITFWAKWETLDMSHWYFPWSKDMNSANICGHSVYVLPSTILFALRTPSTNITVTKTGLSLTTGRWYFIACTYNSTNGQMRVYCYDDAAGILLGNVTNTWSPGTRGYPVCGTGRWYVGGSDYIGGFTHRRMDGLIDEMTVWRRVLSVTEIELIRQGLFPGVTWRAHFHGTGSLSATLTAPSFAPTFPLPCFPIHETLHFRTEILQSHDRTEQRIAKRSGVPRQEVRQRLACRTAPETAEFDNALHKWLKKNWGVPLWWEAVQVGSLSAGAGSIALATAYADFRDDSYALVWQRDSGYEIVEVATVAADSLTLDGTLANSYTAAWVMPLRQGRVLEAVPLERHPGGAALTEMDWLVTDNVAVTRTAGETAALTTYDSLEVVTVPAYHDPWAQRESHAPDLAVRDTGTGALVVVANSTDNIVRQPHLWELRSKEAIWQQRQFWHARKGRQGAFLVPTWRHDLTLSRAYAGGTTLYVQHRNLARDMGSSNLRVYVGRKTGTHTITVRQVTAIAEVSATEETLTINTALSGMAVGSHLCWVDKVRLAEDRVTFEHRLRGNARVSAFLERVP